MPGDPKIERFIEESFDFPHLKSEVFNAVKPVVLNEKKRKFWQQTPLEYVDTRLDNLSDWINAQNDAKNADLLTNGGSRPQSPRFVGHAKSIFSVQNKFTYWWRFREELKKVYRFFGNFALRVENFFRKIVGFEPRVLIPANRPSVANYRNAMQFSCFEELSNQKQSAMVRHQGYGTDLQQVLQSNDARLAGEKLFLTNAPAVCTVDDDVLYDDKLLSAFRCLHKYLENNPAINFKQLRAESAQHDQLSEDLTNDPEIKKRIVGILQGKYRHACHPLTNFALYMYAVSQNGENPVFHNDILTKDCQLIAKNNNPIYFLDKDDNLVCFDPNDCLETRRKTSMDISPNKKFDGGKLAQTKIEVRAHEELYKDKRGKVLAAALHGKFQSYGEARRETPYHLMMHLGYQDNVGFKYDQEFPKAFTASRQAIKRFHVQDFYGQFSEQMWENCFNLAQSLKNSENLSDQIDGDQYRDLLDLLRQIDNGDCQVTSEHELKDLCEDLLPANDNNALQQFKARCMQRCRANGSRKSSTVFNCMAGSNRSQLIMTQYILERFIEQLYSKFQEQNEQDVDLNHFLTGVQKYINRDPYQIIFKMAACVGLETQASQMSQFGFDNNAVCALESSKDDTLSPLMEGVKQQLLFRHNKKKMTTESAIQTDIRQTDIQKGVNPSSVYNNYNAVEVPARNGAPGLSVGVR